MNVKSDVLTAKKIAISGCPKLPTTDPAQNPAPVVALLRAESDWSLYRENQASR